MNTQNLNCKFPIGSDSKVAIIASNGQNLYKFPSPISILIGLLFLSSFTSSLLIVPLPIKVSTNSFELIYPDFVYFTNLLFAFHTAYSSSTTPCLVFMTAV